MSSREKEKGVVFYASFFETGQMLEPNDRLQFYDCILNYGFTGALPEEISITVKALFQLVRPVMDASINRYHAAVENGKKGGAPRGNSNAKKQPKKQPDEQAKNNLEIDNNNKNNNNINNNIPVLFT